MFSLSESAKTSEILCYFLSSRLRRGKDWVRSNSACRTSNSSRPKQCTYSNMACTCSPSWKVRTRELPVTGSRNLNWMVLPGWCAGSSPNFYLSSTKLCSKAASDYLRMADLFRFSSWARAISSYSKFCSWMMLDISTFFRLAYSDSGGLRPWVSAGLAFFLI